MFRCILGAFADFPYDYRTNGSKRKGGASLLVIRERCFSVNSVQSLLRLLLQQVSLPVAFPSLTGAFPWVCIDRVMHDQPIGFQVRWNTMALERDRQRETGKEQKLQYTIWWGWPKLVCEWCKWVFNMCLYACLKAFGSMFVSAYTRSWLYADMCVCQSVMALGPLATIQMRSEELYVKPAIHQP